jgi:PAS domain S-box-containing protein
MLLDFLFGKSSDQRKSTDEIDEILSYVKSIVVREDLIAEVLEKYKQAHAFDAEQKVIACIRTYLALEEFIISNKPMVVQREYTRESLRQEISQKFKLEQLPERFRLLFLSQTEQELMLFELYTQTLASYIASQTGIIRLEEILAPLTVEHGFNGVKVGSNAIDFSTLHANIANLEQNSLVVFFQKLNAALFSEVRSSFGINTAINITQKNYETVAESYNYELISEYLKVLPRDVLTKERVAYMTREDLAKQAADAAEERLRRELAEKSARELQATVDELKRSKETVLNLLTESHKLEEALRAERDRIRTIVSSMNEGLFVVNTDYTIVLINRSTSALLQVPEENLIGKNILDVFPIYKNGNLLDKEINPISIVLRTMQPLVQDIENNLVYRSQEGNSFPIMLSISPLLETLTSTNLGAVIIFRDITDTLKYEQTLRDEKKIIEQKVLEQTKELSAEKDELKKNEAKLLASITSLPLGFILTDMDENVVAINKAAKSILKKPDEATTLAKIDEMLEQKFDLIKKVNDSKNDKVPHTFKDIRLEERFFQIITTPIFLSDTESDYIGAVILLEDATEAKLIDQTKDDFFAIASHELRTPLTAIRGYVSLIQSYYKTKITDPEIFTMINYIDQSSIRLIEIVNEFLNVSRLDQGRIVLKKETFNQVDLVQEVINEVGNLAGDKGLFLKVEKSDGGNYSVTGDKERTKQVITNLVGNAVKFTKVGGITVILENKDNFVWVKVKDTGTGISKESQGRLFKKFQQATDNVLTRDVSNGTGLGLYISKKLIENMGGTIHLEYSQQDVGSCFAFALPSA